MRLRYLRVREKPPLHDTAVVFGREEILGLTGSIHFVVGINGTGKSTLLQTLVETFLALEKGRAPSFPVTLAYDLRLPGEQQERTILFHQPLSGRGEARFLEFTGAVPETANWAWLEDDEGHLNPERLGAQVREARPVGSISSGDLPRFLPDVLLVYTSGAFGNWQRIFAAPPRDDIESILPDLLQEASADNEMPVDWQPLQTTFPLRSADATIGLWIRGEDYRFALLVAVLQQAMKEFDGELRESKSSRYFVKTREQARRDRQPLPERFDESIRSVLDEADWLWPITVSLRTFADPENSDWQRLAAVATATSREPQLPGDDGPAVYRFYYDLRARVNGNNTARRLLRALNEMEPDSSVAEKDEAKPIAALRRLIYWQRRGLTRSSEARIILKKRGVPDPIPLESLSDGERMFLGRMALFYILWDSENALALLDEPETHFNDYWKREIVDILDKSLGERASDVVFTTHSSIALTDAFDKEITLLRRDRENPDYVIAKSPLPPTFGASPTQVLQDIFEGPRAVGQRAAEFLDTILVLISYPEEVVASWPDQPTKILRDAVYERFLRNADPNWTRAQFARAEEQIDKHLKKTLHALYKYGKKKDYADQELLIKVAAELIGKIGPGFYLFELRRRLDPYLNREENNPEQNTPKETT